MEGKLRFLAIPGHSYRIFYDADQGFELTLPEAGDLRTDKDVIAISRPAALANALYRPSDTDSDGVSDVFDNCSSDSNSDQADIDNNGRGDICDDFDRDGRINIKDNCPNHPNYAQSDADKDGIGDACDGEESRFTEAHEWVPWVGMGVAGLVLALLVVLTFKGGIKPVDPPLQ